MSPLAPRQNHILKLVRERGQVGVEDLAEQFGVTPQTIRRDLNELCARKMLQRIHGGATLSSGVVNLGYEARGTLAVEEKRRIGLRAASLIPDNCSLFVNIGTTTEQVARALTSHRGLLVITNNIHVANMLYNRPEIDVIVAGGLVRSNDGGIVGEATADFVKQFKVDFAVIGASAIDQDGSILDYDYREVRVAQEIIRNARQVILVVDSMKMTRSAPVRIGHLSDIDVLVTDAPLADPLAGIASDADIHLEITDEISAEPILIES